MTVIDKTCTPTAVHSATSGSPISNQIISLRETVLASKDLKEGRCKGELPKGHKASRMTSRQLNVMQPVESGKYFLVDSSSLQKVRVKPSLTPGLGTCRLVNTSRSNESSLNFSIEPRTGDEAFREWREAIRRMAHFGDGLPSFVRRRVWSTLADHQLSKQHVDWSHALRLAFKEKPNSGDDSLGSQIAKDLHRTGCDQFGSDEDQAALQQVLLAYARWNKRVGYCQGFNVIAATILEVTERDEKEAFKIMVYLIDYVLPESYFSQNLQALSVDIAVFRHLLQSRLPRLAEHLDRLQSKASRSALATEMNVMNGTSLAHHDGSGGPSASPGAVSTPYEPPLMNVYVIQWFLTLFANSLTPDAVIRIWDSIMLEGSEVILRTAVVIMDFLASRLIKVESADEFYCTMSDLMVDFAEGRIVSTRELCLEIYELAPFPYPNLKELRQKFMYNIAPLVSTTVGALSVGKYASVHSNNSGQAAAARDIRSVEQRSTFGGSALLTLWRRSMDPGSSSDGTRSRVKSHYLVQHKELTENLKSFPPGLLWKSNQQQVNGQVTASTAQSLSVSGREQKLDTQSPGHQDEDAYEEISLTGEDIVDRSNPGPFSKYRLDRIKSADDGKQHMAVEPGLFCAEESTSVKHLESSRHFFKLPWSGTRSSPVAFNGEDFNSKAVISHLDSAVEGVPNTSNDKTGSGEDKANSMQLTSSFPLQKKGAKVDISQVGPGAVGERQPVPLRTPDQSQIKADLCQLRRLYEKQVARQRAATLRIPGLWACGLESSDGLYSPTVTAVLPQTRSTVSVSAHLEPEKIEDAVLQWQMGRGSTVSRDEYPVHSEGNGSPSTSPSHNVCAIRMSTPLPNGDQPSNQMAVDKPCRCLSLVHTCVDRNLVGAVRSWQAKAVWTSSPTPASLEAMEEPVEPESGRAPRNIPLSTTPVELTDTVNQPRRKPTLRELAIGGTLKLNENKPKRDSSISKSDSSDKPSDSPVTSKSDTCTFITSSREAGLIKDPYEDCKTDDLETASFYTCGSHFTAQREPWEDSIDCFATCKWSLGVKSVAPLLLERRPTRLRLPLSHGQRNIGIQLGLYKTDPSGKELESGFTDRLRFVEMNRSIQRCLVPES